MIEHHLNIQAERDFNEQVQALIRLHDMIKESHDPMIKEIAKFMPPVDSRVVVKAIELIKIRDKHV